MVNKLLRVLLVEDSDDDAHLLLRELRHGGYAPEFERVETAAAMKKALKEKTWDVVISDYYLPEFSGLDALSVLKKSGLDIPFLLVSGVIGEEKAVKAMKAGIHDYIMKGNYARLAPAIDRELREAAVRRERRQAGEELRRAKEALEMSRDRYQDLYDFAPLGYMTLDDKGTIQTINLTGARLLGIPRPALSGKPFTSYIRDEDNRNFFKHLQLCKKAGEQIITELGIIIKGGGVIQAQLSTVPYRNEKGETLYRTAITDITERKEAESALRKESSERLRAMEELRERDRILLQQSRLAAMGEMIGYIAHQWRQPLNALGLTIQDIGLAFELGNFTKEQLDQSIATAMDIIFHMSQTIDDFRNLCKPDREKRWFRIKQIMTRVISLIEDNFREHRIAIDVDAAEDLEIKGFHNEFAQVLLNILMNVRDAVLERGTTTPRVVLRAWQEDGMAVVTVHDNAGGIREEHMDKIFDPYFTTKEKGLGTGVGLFISKTIIEKKMGGHLTARNAGLGAEFRIEV